MTSETYLQKFERQNKDKVNEKYIKLIIENDEYFVKKIETLQKQIDSMKNCSNCEGTRYEAFIECPLDIKLCNGKWKLKGDL